MDFKVLSADIRQYVHALYRDSGNEKLIYHSLDHTESVVDASTRIAEYYHLSDKDLFIVNTAAWFHDIGYLSNPAVHEQVGADMMTAFLKDKNVDEETIAAIKNCILATRMPQRPSGLLEQIVCDADLFHLGTDEFSKRNKMMRREAELLKQREISKDDWRAGTIMLFKQHHYHTDYAHAHLDAGKQENLDKLVKKASEKDEGGEGIVQSAIPSDSGTQFDRDPLKEDKKKGDKDKRPERGIETMFRLTSNNNQRLSDMADNKAHIMITVNSIILSAIISLLLRKLDANQYLAIPTYLILAVSLLTILYSILATRPRLPHGTFTKEDIQNKSVNLLFFGNFYKMSIEDYTAGMLQVMNDRDFLYGTLIRDVYSQGVVLGRKYRLLRISYNIFMYGLVTSVLAFVIASISYH